MNATVHFHQNANGQPWPECRQMPAVEKIGDTLKLKGISMNRSAWVRRLLLVITLANLIAVCAGMIFMKKWPFRVSVVLWLIWGVLLQFWPKTPEKPTAPA